MTLPRVPPILAAVALLAAGCGGEPSAPGLSNGCSVTFGGAVSEAAGCEAVVRSNGTTGYHLEVMALRGYDQVGQVRLLFGARPQAGVEYTFTTTGVTSGAAERWVERATTHWAYGPSGVGALAVRFTAVPAIDGPDPTGWDGIGVVHGTFTATLVPASGPGASVTVGGTF